MAFLLGVLGEPDSVMTESMYRADWFWEAFASCLSSSGSQVWLGCTWLCVQQPLSEPSVMLLTCQHRIWNCF